MKMHTRWKSWSRKGTMIGKRLFSDEIGGFYRITKIQSCKEYCPHAEAPDRTHWFDVSRAFITTDAGLKYVVPYIWLYLHSVDENGELLKR